MSMRRIVIELDVAPLGDGSLSEQDTDALTQEIAGHLDNAFAYYVDGAAFPAEVSYAVRVENPKTEDTP